MHQIFYKIPTDVELLREVSSILMVEYQKDTKKCKGRDCF